jgi:hypothetical protein
VHCDNYTLWVFEMRTTETVRKFVYVVVKGMEVCNKFDFGL